MSRELDLKFYSRESTLNYIRPTFKQINYSDVVPKMTDLEARYRPSY